ncbi:MAG: hypothetical protein H7211_04575 [Aquabacterium sp.]|nr:hypothetical protein [Ferruginibacter sp.]
MKKRTLLLTAMLFGVAISWSQKINYQKSFEEARKLSIQQNKPLAVLVTMQPPANVINYLAVLNNPEVVAKFNTSFINYKVASEDTAGSNIVRQYQVYRFPSFVFLDSKGGVLEKNGIIMPFVPDVLTMADGVITASSEKSLTDFDKEYAAGMYSTYFLKAYITKRKKAGIANNADLIEKYVDSLTIAGLGNYQQVLFILQAGPLADSRAYKLAYTNKSIIDSIYKTEPYAERTAINNGIIVNTMASAIVSKNFGRAISAANFTRGTWTSDYGEGQKNYALKLLQYYTGIKDTVNYLREATVFYDQYYMNISTDSIKKREEQKMETAKRNAREKAEAVTPNGGVIKTFSFAYAPNVSATELNNAAWAFYKSGTQDGTYLTKALLWSKRSIELNAIAGYYDTLAHLLYRLGFYAEAKATQQKAIDLSKAEKRNVKEMEEELAKIEQKTL